MSSRPCPQGKQRSASPGALPYDSYADVLRRLVPGLQKICFYDAAVRTLWISDGVDEPELKMRTHQALSRGSRVSERRVIGGVERTVCIAPIGGSRGALTLVLDSPADPCNETASDHLPAITSIVEILTHALRDEVVQQPAVELSTRLASRAVDRAPIVGPAARATAAPVLLRRALGKAVTYTDCAFGALMAIERPLTFTHPVTAPEPPAELQQIAEGLRSPLAQLVQGQRQPVIVTSSDPLWVSTGEYKFVVCPVVDVNDQLAAVLVLFRRRQEPDFAAADCAALLEIARSIPAHALHELAPPLIDSVQAAALIEPAPKALRTSARPTFRRRIGKMLQQRERIAQRGRASLSTPDLEPQLMPAPAPLPSPDTPRRPEPQPEPEEVTLEQRVRDALRGEGFELHAQSISAMRADSRLRRCEVLIRLRDGDTLQPPPVFFETAEDAGLMIELDRWVVSHLLRSVRNGIDTGEWEFAINVSQASLLRTTFGDFIESQLFRSGVPAQALVFEFAECDVVEHRVAFESLAPRLTALGCRVALDNCRQGIDIFACIGRLPVHRLKIDATLTNYIATDARAAQMVRELVEVASDVGIETVGECIENEHTWRELQSLGVDFAQGYFLAQPQPLIQLLN